MLVISPHLDDAVLSCGQRLAGRPGCTVVTVFAGTPADAGQLTDWDHRSGFRDAGHAMAARRAEDREALARLGARPVWLDFLDAQYQRTPQVAELETALAASIGAAGASLVLYPLGLFHSDHRLAHAASRAALRAHPGVTALAYEDVPYRGRPGLLQQRLAELAEAGVRATPAHADAEPASPALKAHALRAYESQWRAFGDAGLADAAQPERFWILEEVADHAA